VISPERHWYRLSWLSIALLPAAAAFRLVSALRKMAYRHGLFRSQRLDVPVIVVGNITAGGTGKTPLVIWLCNLLRERGFHPGIVSRGYGAEGVIRNVRVDSNPAAVGDEPALLAVRTGCPVWIGHDRVGAARALLLAHPDCNVIVSDDGLQHYRLRRDFEIAVVDAARGLGNGLPIPAGPLREPASRLNEVTAVVFNGAGPGTADKPGNFVLSMEGALFRNLLNPAFTQEAAGFLGKRVHALAGIGNPLRFFEHLQHLGLSFTAHPFPDHHAFAAAEIEFAGADAIIMTEKDAIKCQPFARENHWVLPVDARVSPGLDRLILDKLGTSHGP
jgi:tetraacyldisaccharide 4'-kinase